MVRWYFDSKGPYSIQWEQSTPFGEWLFKTEKEAWQRFSLKKKAELKECSSSVGSNISKITNILKSLVRARMALIRIALKK